MSPVLERLRKKRAYPVKIDGDVFHVRSLTIGELRRLDAVSVMADSTDSAEEKAQLRTGLFYALAICADETGEAAFPKLVDESDASLARRIKDEFSDVPLETLRAIGEAVQKIGQTPKVETIVKN